MSYTVSEGFLEKMKKKQNEKEEREKKAKKIADRAKAIQEAKQKKLQADIDRVNGKETSDAKAFEEKFGYAPIDTKSSMTYPITPTPEEDEGFFKAGAFDDGYQFGDVTKTVIGTAGDFLGNAAKGFWSMFEGIGDTIFHGASGLADLVGADDVASYLKNEANHETVEKWFAPFLNDVDQYSVLGSTMDIVAQGVGSSTAMMLPSEITQILGLGTKAAGLATTGMKFVSSFGSGMSEAYNSGATDTEAVVFSILKGAVDAGSEALSGGIGKVVNALGISHGIGGVDDMIANKLTKKLTNQTVKSLAKYGIKSAGEGLEGILAGLGTAVAKKITYMSEEDFGKLIEDENLLESFVTEALSSAISQSPDVVNSVKTGRDFVTNYTQDEQKVIDKVIENKIAEAEKNGKKLTNKEKSKIAEEAKTYVERGYVSVKELEDILGDKTELDALNKEYEEFNKLYESKPGDLSKKDTDRLAELESKYKEQSYEDRVKAALGKISTDVYNKANGGYLAETYREVERSKQDFQYDLSQYVGSKHYDAVKQTYENAVKANANNTNAVHDLVDMNAKLSSETGLVYEYKTQDEINSEFIKNKQNEIRKLQNKKNLTDEQNKKLSALKQLVEDVKSGKVNIDGNIDVSSGKVTLNVNSKKMLQITVGHELTRNLEQGKGKSSESYNALKDAVFAYAESKGINIKNELEKKSLEYLGVDGADPEMELVADLVGEYLFTDSEFVNQLTTNNRNLAQRIYDKIKHLLKLATAGSKEARNLEKAKKAFEEAFRQSGEFTANSKRGSVRYSVGENITESQNEKGLNSEQEVSYSLANNSKYMEKAFAANDTSFNVERTLLEEAKAVREKVAERMNEIKDRGLVGLPEDIEGNTYIANSSYDGTEENTTICPRSLASEAFVDAVSEYLGRPLSVEEQIYISQDLQGRSLTPECTYCYVATDRKAYRAFLGEYIKQRDSVIEKIKVNPDADVSVNGELYKEFLNGRKPTPQMYSRFKMWVDAYKNGTPMVEASHLANINKLMGDINSEFGDVLKPQITDAMKYAQAASWAKKRVNYVAYNGHILNWKQDRINKLNSHYGLRMYSFSDFHPAFVLENMQMITDASVRGLKMLGYTKDIDFVDIFAPTGMNINVSTFGFESGGNVYENNLIGAEWEKAKALREQYPNVGITFVATNDTLVNWALEQDWIDVVIPYHLVRTGAEVAKAFNYTNYTSESSDTKDIGWTKGSDKKYIAPTEHNNDKATYLAALKKNHLKPRFERFIDNPNYMKLVNECRQSASESKPVKPVFNEEAAMVALAKLEANGYYQPIGGSVDRMYEIASEVAENMIAPTKQSLSSSNKNAKPNIFNTNSGFYNTERSNETTVDAPVAEEYNVDTFETSPDVEAVDHDERVSEIVNSLSNFHRSRWYKVGDYSVIIHKSSWSDDVTMSIKHPDGTIVDEEITNGKYIVNDRLKVYIAEAIATAEESAGNMPPTRTALNAQTEDIDPVFDTSSGQQAFMPEAEAPKTVTRGELHENIVDNIKSTFYENGYDLDEVLKNAKDLSTFATVDNTPQRVMEKALGYKQGQVLADLTVNKVAQNETEGIKWLNSFTDRKNGLLAQISKRYNIKPGSKASAAAQMYAEGFYVGENGEIISYGDAELAKDFPDANVQRNIKGLARDPRIRQIYDETLAAINESRARNAYPEIPRLDNYFLHFRAMDDTFSRLGLPFNPNDIRAKDLPTDLNGVTADLKPGQPYFASAMHRKGKRTSFDLLGGLEKYLTSAKNQIYHIDDIQNLRALRNYIADNYGQANGLDGLDALSEEEAQEKIEKVFNSHLSTFAKFLNEEANVLAGKTTLIDRGLEGVIGRRGITFLDSVNRQVGANMVGYNVSSSLTNFLAPVQGFAKSNKADFIKGFAQFSANKVKGIFGKNDGFADNSPVMIRRKGAERFHRTAWQKMSDPGYALMGAVDNISTELLARAKYNEFTRKGMDSQQAHIETDKWVSRLMGDRSLGQQPQLYNSKTLGLFTKFQLEVRNQLDSQFYDTIQDAKVSTEDIENGLARNAKKAAKITSAFFQLAVGQHLFGKAFESITGYNPAFDIISVLLTAFGFDDDEDSEDTALDNIEQAFLELLGDLPYTSTLTGGRIPISSALPITEFITGEDQYGNKVDENPILARVKTVAGALPYYLMPGGNGQAKKTIQGLGMFSDEHPIAGSYTDNGDLRFPVEDTLGNRIQAGLFGQWASGNASDYFDNERKPLNEKQIQEFMDVGLSIQDYWDYRDGLSGLNTLAEKADYINSLNLTTEQKNVLINNLADREEDIDMSDYGSYESFEEFDFATKNPEKYSFFEENGISYSDYASADEDGKRAYTWAYENPGKYKMSQVVTSDIMEYYSYKSDLGDIKADKDENGKTISGSAKDKKIEYINGLDLEYGQKIILFKSEYPADDSYNEEIVNYLVGRNDISREDTISILTTLGFSVSSDGRVSW